MPATDSWLIDARPGRAGRLRLFCLPYAGGGSAMFRTWPDLLPADVEVRPVQLPGRETRLLEPARTSVAEVVDELAPVVAALTDRPYAVFGHSMGAVIGFELVRRLRAMGAPEPSWLLVSAREAPHVAYREEVLHVLPDPEFVVRLRGYGGTPSEILDDPDLQELFLPKVRADFTLIETYEYVPGAPLTCPVAAFSGTEDPQVDRDRTAAWAQLTRGPFVHHELPGGHFFLHTCQDQLAGHIATLLASAGAAAPQPDR